MAVKQINKFLLDDMTAEYVLDEESRIPELMLYPAGLDTTPWESKRQNIDGLIQLKILGDRYTGSYSGGISMRQSESVSRMKFVEQKEYRDINGCKIQTVCRDSRGYKCVHNLIWKKGRKTLEIYVDFCNESEEPVALEMLESFSLGGISPFFSDDGAENLYLHRIRGVWSEEGRLETTSLEELQLEPSWAPGHAVRCERFGAVGSLTVNKFFPCAVIEDRKNHAYWGAQIAHNASWQMEIYRRDEAVSLSGGIADREFGQWIKSVKPGEIFSTPAAILTTARNLDTDEFFQRLVSGQEDAMAHLPEQEKDLPLIFNEYCTTWGNPSQKNIEEILKVIQNKGFKYFVIDCGWYKTEGVPWSDSMGDYVPSAELFPEGLGKISEKIREAGMIPGLWFEIDNVGRMARAYTEEEHLLKRDGYVLTTETRRFWDMRQEWVQNYLTEKVIAALKKNGFQYIKMDYNETLGIGCDGAESLGEGLRQNMEASYGFIEKIKKDIPGIIIENCASGGHKLEPKMMGISSMASFSDAHECLEIPIIAANLHRAILPRQSQIWAVVRKEDSRKRLVYSMCNTFFGRCCLSGDVTELNDEQWAAVDEGLDFYQRIAPIIKKGCTHYFGEMGKSWRKPQGWQGIFRENEEGAFAVFHIFGGEIPKKAFVQWHDKDYIIDRVYSDTKVQLIEKDRQLIFYPEDNWKAAAVYLKRKF